jgi:hypothetical protein
MVKKRLPDASHHTATTSRSQEILDYRSMGVVAAGQGMEG